MKNKIIGIIIVIVFLVVILVVYLNNPKTNNIVIGAVIPQTGFGAYWGDPVLKGIKLAEFDLRSKYPDRNISVIIEDSQSKAPVAVSAAQKLLSINKADAIYSEFSGMSSAISPIVKALDKIFVYSAFNQKIVEDNDISLKTFISFEKACDALGSYLNDSNKKVLIISSIGDSAPYCVRGLERHLSISNIKVIDGIKDNDFKTILLQNKSFGPDYIIPMMYEDGSYALIKQKNELGIKTNFFCYKQDCVTEKLLKDLPQKWTEDIVYFQIPLNESFVSKIKTLYPDMTNDDMQGAANSYQSIMILGEGLTKCSDKSGKCVKNIMGNEKNLSYSAYEGASFVNGVLNSNVLLGTIKSGSASLLK